MDCTRLLRYDMDDAVEAFTAGCGSVLPYNVITGHQVHGVRVAVIDRPDLTRQDLEGYDAFITNLRDCAIGVRTADCIPVLMYDPVHKAVGAVHSGWKGTVAGISACAINAMALEFGTMASDIKAVIGPGICRESFQVGQEVVGMFREAGFPMERIYEWQGECDGTPMRGGHHIDLFQANSWILESAGVQSTSIQTAGICTYIDSRFYSARREGAACGRNINAIKIT